jgi:hypothetical protein
MWKVCAAGGKEMAGVFSAGKLKRFILEKTILSEFCFAEDC